MLGVDVVPLPSAAKRGGYVYFVRCETDDGHIKIGRARHISARLTDLQICCPYPLRVVAFMWSSDPVALEWKMQAIHNKDRIRGEWFRLSPKLMGTIVNIRRQAIREKDEEIAAASTEVQSMLLAPLPKRKPRASFESFESFEWRGKVRAQ